MVEPTDLYELANEIGVKMCGLYQSDDINPDWSCLDKDEDP